MKHIVIAAGLVLVAASAQAAKPYYYTWNPGVSGFDWFSSANWDEIGGQSYPDDNFDQGVFPAKGSLADPILDSEVSGTGGGMGQLVFSSGGWTVTNQSGEDNNIYFSSVEWFAYDALYSRGSGTNIIEPRVVFYADGQNVYTETGNTLRLDKVGLSGYPYGFVASSESPTNPDTGTISLPNDNSNITGAFRVRQGRLLVGNSNALGIGGGTIQFGDTYTAANAYAYLLTGNSGVTIDKPLQVTNTVASINAIIGGAQAGGASTFSNTLQLDVGATLVSANTDGNAVSFNNTVSGVGGITKNGVGTVILGHANTYQGNTVIRQGILKLGSAGSLPSTTGVSLDDISGATLNLNGYSQSVTSLSGGGANGGGVALGSATLTVGSGNYSGCISGTGGLTKTGAGALILNRANSYGGATSIQNGELRLGIAGALPGATTVSLGNISGAVLNLNGFAQTIATLSGGGAGGGNVALASGTLTVGGGTYSGSISGTGGLTKTGAGVLILNRANSYGGTTSIQGGELWLGAVGALPTTTTVSLDNTSGVALNLNGFPQTIATLTGGGADGGNVALGLATLTVGGGAYSGSISGLGGLTKTGLGLLLLNRANTYAGSTSIQGGELRLCVSGALPSTTSVIMDNIFGTVLNLNGFSLTVASLSGGGTSGGGVALGAGTLTVTSGNYSGSISGSGGLTKAGMGTLLLNRANTYGGATTIQDGELRLGAADVLPATTALSIASVPSAVFNLNDCSQTIASLSGGGVKGGSITLGSGVLTIGGGNYSGTITGSGGLTKTGEGLLILKRTTSYGGATSIQGGELRLGSAGVLPSSTAVSLDDVSGALLNLNDFPQTIASLSGGGSNGGNVALGSGTLTVGGGNYSGSISGSGGLTKTGTGALALNRPNSYGGVTMIQAGELKLGASGALPATTAVSLDNILGALLNLNDFPQTIARLSGGGSNGGNVALGSGTLTVGGGYFAGSISGSGGLTKTGPDTLALNCTNLHGGPTTVEAGVLSLTIASLSDTSDLWLAADATLDLHFDGTDTVGSFLIDGVPQIRGTWGSPTSSAEHKTNRITGTGMLNAAAGPTPYEAWIAAYGLTSPDNEPLADPDHDGISNLLEWILGGNPLANSTGVLPQVGTDSGNLVVTFTRGDDSESTTILTAQWSVDFQIWNDVAIGSESSGPDENGVSIRIVENGDLPDAVTVLVPTANASAGALFVRLAAVTR